MMRGRGRVLGLPLCLAGVKNDGYVLGGGSHGVQCGAGGMVDDEPGLTEAVAVPGRFSETHVAGMLSGSETNQRCERNDGKPRKSRGRQATNGRRRSGPRFEAPGGMMGSLMRGMEFRDQRRWRRQDGGGLADTQE